MQDAAGLSPLHGAAVTGNIRGVRSLLDRGANVNAMDNGGATPLDSVGDYMYRLIAKGTRREVNEGGGDQFTLFSSDIETYIYLEIVEALEKAGGKYGKDLGPLPTLSPEAVEVSEQCCC